MSKLIWLPEENKMAKLEETNEGWVVKLYHLDYLVAYNVFSQYVQAMDEIENWLYPY